MVLAYFLCIVLGIECQWLEGNRLCVSGNVNATIDRIVFKAALAGANLLL